MGELKAVCDLSQSEDPRFDAIEAFYTTIFTTRDGSLWWLNPEEGTCKRIEAPTRFTTGYQVCVLTVVSDRNGQLWRLNPQDGTCKPVKVSDGQAQA